MIRQIAAACAVLAVLTAGAGCIVVHVERPACAVCPRHKQPEQQAGDQAAPTGEESAGEEGAPPQDTQ